MHSYNRLLSDTQSDKSLQTAGCGSILSVHALSLTLHPAVDNLTLALARNVKVAKQKAFFHCILQVFSLKLVCPLAANVTERFTLTCVKQRCYFMACKVYERLALS